MKIQSSDKKKSYIAPLIVFYAIEASSLLAVSRKPKIPVVEDEYIDNEDDII